MFVLVNAFEPKPTRSKCGFMYCKHFCLLWCWVYTASRRSTWYRHRHLTNTSGWNRFGNFLLALSRICIQTHASSTRSSQKVSLSQPSNVPDHWHGQNVTLVFGTGLSSMAGLGLSVLKHGNCSLISQADSSSELFCSFNVKNHQSVQRISMESFSEKRQTITTGTKPWKSVERKNNLN